jgi:hypothetical protein
VRLLETIKRLFPSLERGDYASTAERPVENLDAEAAQIRGAGGPAEYPPGYVKDYDEGRPRK